MHRLVILVSVVALAALTWALLGTASKSDEDGPAPTDRVPAVRLKIPLGSFSSTSNSVATSGDAGVVDAAILTKRKVAKLGLMGQETRWIESIMDQPSWQQLSGTPTPAYKNTNNVVLKFSAPSGRVTKITAEFPENSASADLTGLTEYIIGNQTHLPVHFEVYRRPDGTPRLGDFLGPDGRRYYYRGVYRQGGDPPYGPQEFAVSTAPFENQPIQLDEHRDEHSQPRTPIPVDGGLQ